jgi:MFS family permease
VIPDPLTPLRHSNAGEPLFQCLSEPSAINDSATVVTHRDSPSAARHGFGKWLEPPPLRVLEHRGYYPWLVVGTVCIGAFMGQVDASIAQLVVPELRSAFHARIDEVAWVSIAYLLVVTVMLPIVGRLADMLGRKPLYWGGFIVFVIGSALCGLAPDLETLIGARVLQALGACLLQANSVAIIVAIAGEARRGRALGLQPAAQAVGLSAGPALGGVLISTLGWRWVFWINVPTGLFGAWLGLLVLPRSERRSKVGWFDLGERFCWLRHWPSRFTRSIRSVEPRSAHRG